MSEPRRADAPPPTAAAANRDGQVEALLVDGLDHYFAGRYAEAIHVWTRVLFLDRTHARARAYIDRARSALAERQRHADQMLHETGESLAQGDTDRARQLLSEAVETAGDDERAAGLRVRLERLERARVGTTVGPLRSAAVVDAVPVPAPWTAGWAARGLALSAGAILLVALLTAIGVSRGWLSFEEPAPPPVLSDRGASAPALSSPEVAVIRAQTLFARGRLAEALQVLEGVPGDSDQREAADQLRVRIQQVLLALARSGPGAPPNSDVAGQP